MMRLALRAWLVALGGLALLVGVGTVVADTMWVPTVELREEDRGYYVLEADVARILVGTALPPVLPAGCVADAEPEITDRGATFRVNQKIRV